MGGAINRARGVPRKRNAKLIDQPIDRDTKTLDHHGDATSNIHSSVAIDTEKTVV
jgi:hypothetical protein